MVRGWNLLILILTSLSVQNIKIIMKRKRMDNLSRFVVFFEKKKRVYFDKLVIVHTCRVWR